VANELHRVYLDIGSNVEAESNLPKAVSLLRKAGHVEAVSSVWETESVGYDGPNFLNACVLMRSSLSPAEFKEQLIRPIESKMGRVRGKDKNAPRPIDIDIVLFDETPHNAQTWEHAFVIVPLAELQPNFRHPTLGESLSQSAGQVKVWIKKRADVVISVTGI
jgi:2-amino-4-hydroxy-6-hydroxymethyldihydropteridine diphosphokinase